MVVKIRVWILVSGQARKVKKIGASLPRDHLFWRLAYRYRVEGVSPRNLPRFVTRHPSGNSSPSLSSPNTQYGRLRTVQRRALSTASKHLARRDVCCALYSPHFKHTLLF